MEEPGKAFFVDPTLYEGRPADETKREAREIATYDLLNRLGIPFGRVDHDAAKTIADCVVIDQILGVEMCKNLFLCNAQRTQFYLLMLRGDKPFKTKDVSRQIGSARLSFADAEHMEEFLDIHPGAVSVMGLLHDRDHRVRLLIDRDVLTGEWIGCHPCVNTSSLRVRTQDLLDVFLPYTGHKPCIVEV